MSDLQTLTLLDPAIQDCPFPAYELLQREAPVFYDRRAGFWVITRYDDIRRILTDPARFSSSATVELARESVDPVRASAIREIYEAEGLQPMPTLSLLDDPRHKEIRAIFQHALRAGKIKELDSLVADIARQLVDDFLPDGRCDVVRQFCVPLPLITICSQVGAPIDDVWIIKRWTDAWVRRFSMMQSADEEVACVRQEIEFQRYFVPIIDGLRRSPNGSLLSDLVNLCLSDGSQLSEAELVSHLLADIFVGGSETSTNAMSEGILLLCRNASQYALLQGDLDRHLPGFVDEVLRLQTPVQGLYRVTTAAVELQGVTIPARSLLNLRFAAANRDERHFSRPAELDVERNNSGSHLAFGSGIHHCIGAPLARRELHWGFYTLLRHCMNIRLVPGANDFGHMPGLMLRALKELHIDFDAAPTVSG